MNRVRDVIRPVIEAIKRRRVRSYKIPAGHCQMCRGEPGVAGVVVRDGLCRSCELLKENEST